MVEPGTEILVIGLGKSGKAVAERALKKGAVVWAYEDDEEKLKKFCDSNEIKVFDSKKSPKIDLVVPSPGIPFNHPLIRRSSENNWPVQSEIEFAYSELKPDFIIGVTGTNGKTSVVEMLAHIYKKSNKPFTLAGNIGKPLSSIEKLDGPLILELSSFQLHFIDRFRANVAAVLNVTDDHYDWHCCFGQYLEDKLKILKNQKDDDVGLVNFDDQILAKLKNDQKIIGFGSDSEARYKLNDKYLMANGEGIIAIEDIELRGKHNQLNALAAMACAREAGLEWPEIKDGILSFKGLDHRIQYVDKKNNISFYNDSKSTNPDSTKKAIESFDEPVILIMGGRNKGSDFSFIKDYLGSRVKDLIIYGEAAKDISKQTNGGSLTENVEQALGNAFNKAAPGDIILFSPGCSSFDLFSNYAQRGDAFMKAVRKLNG